MIELTFEPVLFSLMNCPLGSHSDICTFPLAVDSVGCSGVSESVLLRFLLGVTTGVIFNLKVMNYQDNAECES